MEEVLGAFLILPSLTYLRDRPLDGPHRGAETARRRTALSDADSGVALQSKNRAISRLIAARSESPLSAKRLALELRRVTKAASV